MNHTWASVAKLLPPGAALLGTALGGPITVIADGVGSLLAHAIGSTDSTPGSVAKAIQADPETAATKILELQTNTQISLQQMATQQTLVQAQGQVNSERENYSDTATSTDGSIKVIQVTGHNRRADVLAYGALSAFVLAIVPLNFLAIPPPSHDAMLVLLGILGAVVKDVYGFEFGSSRQDKTGVQRAALQQLVAQEKGPVTPFGTVITEMPR